MHEVRIILSLPMSPSAFNDDKQTLFKASLAQAAGVSSEAVVIHRIESLSTRRHLLAESIRIETSIFATDEAGAATIAGKLTADNINAELTKARLPSATVLEAAKPALTSQTSTEQEVDSSDPEFSDSRVYHGACINMFVCVFECSFKALI